MDAARELLRYGLEGTELESLIALNQEDRGDLVRGRRDRHVHHQVSRAYVPSYLSTRRTGGTWSGAGGTGMFTTR